MSEGRRPAGEYSRYERKLEMLRKRVRVLVCGCVRPVAVKTGARRVRLGERPKCALCGKTIPEIAEKSEKVRQLEEKHRVAVEKAAERRERLREERHKLAGEERLAAPLMTMSALPDLVEEAEGLPGFDWMKEVLSARDGEGLTVGTKSRGQEVESLGAVEGGAVPETDQS